MISFEEFINESQEVEGDHPQLDLLEKEGDCKPLALKYVIFFKDQEINDAVRCYYLPADQKFEVTVHGTFFDGETWKTSKARSALNFIKLLMISKKFKNGEMLDELKWCITKDRENLTWYQMRMHFLDRIEKSEMKLKPEEYEALGISKTNKISKDFGV